MWLVGSVNTINWKIRMKVSHTQILIFSLYFTVIETVGDFSVEGNLKDGEIIFKAV